MLFVSSMYFVGVVALRFGSLTCHESFYMSCVFRVEVLVFVVQLVISFSLIVMYILVMAQMKLRVYMGSPGVIGEPWKPLPPLLPFWRRSVLVLLLFSLNFDVKLQ